MAGYIIYWSKDHVADLKRAGDAGPLSVVFGGPHTAMPSIVSLKVGDLVYPVTIQDGTLCVMARMRVEKIEAAIDYLLRETGGQYSALIPKDMAIEELHRQKNDGKEVSWFWMSGANYVNSRKAIPPDVTRIVTLAEQRPKPHKLHQEPHMCCAERAASGAGSEIRPRPLPVECLPELRFGPKKSLEKALRLNQNGRPITASLSGFIRRMSIETQAVFDALFLKEELM